MASQSARAQARRRSETAVSSAIPKLFISHSSEDSPLAKLLIDALKASLRLSAEEIRCTSVDGFKLRGGIDIQSTLRNEVQAETFIGLISDSSLDSLYVGCELGSRWGSNKRLIPLFAPGFDGSKLREPLNQLNGLRCDNRNDLIQLIGELATDLHRTVEPSPVFESQLDAVVRYRMSAASYGVKIKTPAEGEIIKHSPITVTGTFERKPLHSSLRIFAVSADSKRWWPVSQARLTSPDSWSAGVTFDNGDFDIVIVAALVSKSSGDLVRYFETLPSFLEGCNKAGQTELKDRKEFDALFKAIMPHGIETCAERRVHVSIGT